MNLDSAQFGVASELVYFYELTYEGKESKVLNELW